MAAKRKPERVFVLGAGASASSGLPVSQYILSEAMGHLHDHDVGKWDSIIGLLEYLYPNFNEALRNYPNIEDFMNLIEMAIEFNTEDYIQSSLWPGKRLSEVKNAALQMVTDYIWSATNDCNRGPVRKFVDCCLREGDTVVTFNWDLTIENALEKSERFDFWYSPTTEILLLKPHGSIDWFLRGELPREVARRDVKKIDDELCVYPEFTLAKYQKLKKIAPVIVPPVFQKDFGRRFFKETWRRTYRKIAAANDLFFIGYSLPKEDQFARLVLSRALWNNKRRIGKGEKPALNVTIVNPDDAVQVTFMRLLGQGGKTNLRYFQTTFDQFVDSVEDGSTELDMRKRV